LVFTLKDEDKWRVFENRCWGEYLDRRERKYKEAEENCIMMIFIICTHLQTLLEL
jgi:hypothetical protein